MCKKNYAHIISLLTIKGLPCRITELIAQTIRSGISILRCPIHFVYKAKHSSLLPTDAAPVSLETNFLIHLFLSQVAFIVAVIFSLGGRRTITSEESPWGTTKQTAARRKRSVGTPEPSCFSGIYRVEEVSKGIMAKIPVCRDVASARDKCLGATFQTYGKRACEPYYEKVNIGGGIFKIPTKCMCKV